MVTVLVARLRQSLAVWRKGEAVPREVVEPFARDRIPEWAAHDQLLGLPRSGRFILTGKAAEFLARARIPETVRLVSGVIAITCRQSGAIRGKSDRSEERRVGKECRSRW